MRNRTASKVPHRGPRVRFRKLITHPRFHRAQEVPGVDDPQRVAAEHRRLLLITGSAAVEDQLDKATSAHEVDVLRQ